MTTPSLTKIRFRTRTLPIFILVVLSVGLSLGKLWESWTVNRWSIAYLSQSQSMENEGAEKMQVPEGHARAPAWLAWEAIEVGEPELALEITNPILDSGDIFGLRVRGEALAGSGDFEAAVNAWVQAGDFLSLLKAAQENEANDLLENAEQAYEGAWKVNPSQGILPLTNFYWHVKGDLSAAERVLRRSLGERHSSHLHQLLTLGRILEAQSRWDEAMAVYKEAQRQKPNDIYTLRLIGFAYLNGFGNFDGASKIFMRIISLAPDMGDGYFAMGQLMAKQDRFDEADRWFLQALIINPNVPKWWVIRANTARQAQNISLALDIYDQAIHQFPDYANAYYEMAWAYRMDDKPEGAIKSIEQAIALERTPREWYYRRAGRIYEWAGEQGLAIKAYRRALELAPTNPSTLNALQRLDVSGE